jgi:hypothetical protein
MNWRAVPGSVIVRHGPFIPAASIVFCPLRALACLELAEHLGLPVDAGRMGAYGPNVTVLRDFARSSRQPL